MTNTQKPSFKNISEIAEFVQDSTWGGMNDTMHAEIYKIGDRYFKKCFPSWIRRAKVIEMDACEIMHELYM